MVERVTHIEEKWDITYLHATGKVTGDFFTKLRDDKVIIGRRCPECNRVLVPPRSFCDRCYVDTNEWVQVKPEGVLEVYTIVRRAFKGLPEPPYVIGYVRLDGADTSMLNFIRGIDVENSEEVKKLKVGARANVVFSEERQGRITDFWFELVKI